jgi:hypothetical protein
VGFLFSLELNYLVSTLVVSTDVVSTTPKYSAAVESVQTAVESHDLTSVDVPFPHDANATIANNATICFIIVLICFVYKNFNFFLIEFINIDKDIVIVNYW